MMTEKSFWLAVASADHVRRGRREGFMQVSHGKAGPLRRIRPGDGVVYYSPSSVYGEKGGLRHFTAIGVVREGEPYQGDMGGGFTPFRRDIDWADASEAPIAPLLDRLELTAGKANWGYQLRFGLLKIGEGDFRLIAETMGAALPTTSIP
ncbi:EVE domain-containing protein [Mesorhizobium sp. IMUNJ 23232]|uniref:EVE domain-containing protein n=1 Tax=Mesorhizobium sp. IMUNJ 23232 TaxID=3376064 RepID=UPI003793CAEE